MIQVVQSVRSEFEKAMVGGADDLAPGYRISTGDSRRLTAIEELIKEQRQLLLSLNAHFVCAV
uniref:V-SNARE domain-containing protein n=1 Tax=Ascaris lumbricoides TaxID=6252 RepID=A0A0M3HJD6_ASCLU